MNTINKNSSWMLIAAIAIIACLAGYGFAKWTQPNQSVETSEPGPSKPTAKTASTEISIPQPFIDSSGIEVGVAEEGSASAELMVPAIVAAIPGGEATIIARASGTVTKINKRLGDPVKAGEVLALVDSMEATGISADRYTALAKLDLARKTFNRESRLYEQGVTARQEMESAQSSLAIAEAESQRANSMAKAAKVAQDGNSVMVVSPVDGRITAESVILGAFVQPDSNLFKVANNSQVQIEAYVTAADIDKIQPGDSASLLTRSGKTVNASVRSVTPTVSGGNQAATVILIPATGDSSFVIGEGIQVRLHTKPDATHSLLVADEAIQNLDGQDVVFVRTENGFTPTPVAVGSRSGGLAQILSGIEKGTELATKNAFLIKAEMIKSTSEAE